MRTPNFRYFVGDFETTVYAGQVNTEVWASACVELGSEDVKIFHSIGEQFEYFVSLNTNICCYYHNLKFDGTFWMSYLLTYLGMKQAFTGDINSLDMHRDKVKNMPNNSFSYVISDMGQWYTMTIKYHNKIIELRDSLKLLPFSVKIIGESFQTKHKKLDMKYTGVRYAGCKITEEEKAYIANDVLVVKEALELMFSEGHKNLTIGGCCLKEYEHILGKQQYNVWFPDMYAIPLDKDVYGSDNAGEYIRKSYRGGWCYLVKGKECKMKYNGTTADVNSLYPSMMSSESGNIFPVGEPHFWKGDYIPYDIVNGKTVDTNYQRAFYFVRLKTRFYIKENMLPFIQIKSSFMYKGTECLETSDIFNPEDGEYHSEYVDLNGELQIATVTMTMTMMDYNLLNQHYELIDLEILDGCWFRAYSGIFDEYIEKYKRIKLESKGARRELAKLFLNNLYGKMASSTNSSFKYAYVKDDGSLGFVQIQEFDKKAGYIPVGSAITSYARCFTIKAAQANYYGVNKRGFIYADTDSIHCDLEPDEIKGITVHPKNFCCWKLESCWDYGYFTRQKTYIEHITKEDLEEIEEPYFNVKCAGMPEKCKNLFIKSMEGYEPTDEDEFTQDELDFLSVKRTINDFKVGLRVPGKLMPKQIQGGTLLVDTFYEMRG